LTLISDLALAITLVPSHIPPTEMVMVTDSSPHAGNFWTHI